MGGVSDTQKKAIKYAITIMHSNQMMALPYRSYVWRGGVYVAPDPKAGQEWCFVYGEKEWMEGKNWLKARIDASPFDEVVIRRLP